MNCSQQLSDVTTNYLCRFYKILDEMIEGMTNAELTNSLSHNFIVQMIPHHRAAIEMSENLLQYTTFVPLQRIAQNIVNEQTKSIENMQSVLPHCAQLSNSEKDLCLYDRRFRQITQTMFSQMRNACSNNNINANFMREMIPHHQGAIQMSKNVLQYPSVRNLTLFCKPLLRRRKKGCWRCGVCFDASAVSKSINCLVSSLVYTSAALCHCQFFCVLLRV